MKNKYSYDTIMGWIFAIFIKIKPASLARPMQGHIKIVFLVNEYQTDIKEGEADLMRPTHSMTRQNA